MLSTIRGTHCPVAGLIPPATSSPQEHLEHLGYIQCQAVPFQYQSLNFQHTHTSDLISPLTADTSVHSHFIVTNSLALQSARPSNLQSATSVTQRLVSPCISSSTPPPYRAGPIPTGNHDTRQSQNAYPAIDRMCHFRHSRCSPADRLSEQGVAGLDQTRSAGKGTEDGSGRALEIGRMRQDG